jgi:hypothetical protein
MVQVGNFFEFGIAEYHRQFKQGIGVYFEIA